MKITTVKKLQQKFQGKICTILTHPIAKRDFNDAQFADFFTGVVDEIDDDGIFTTHALTACKNFYFFTRSIYIVSDINTTLFPNPFFLCKLNAFTPINFF